MNYYNASLKWTAKDAQYITFWRPKNEGYAWPLSWSGTYTWEQVMESPDYYNNGADTVAVPCDVVDGLAVAPQPRTIDNDAGPVVMNTKDNWKAILDAVIAPPAQQPWPEIFGRRKRIEQAVG